MKKFIYSLKLSLVAILCILFFALVEIAPYQPILFLSMSIIYIVSIRHLWKSVKRDERRVKQAIHPIKKEPSEQPGKNKRAA